MAIISVEKIKNKISSASFDDIVKQKLLDSLPYLGNNCRRFLNVNFSQSGIREDIPVLEIISVTQQLMQGLSSGNFKDVINFLQSALENPEYEFGRYIIPFAQDIREYCYSNGVSEDEGILDVLRNFESKLFRFLPSEELEKIVKEDLLYFVRALPVLVGLKQIYWLVELSDDGTWGAKFRKILEENQELLGSTDLTRDGKIYPQTIGNWLKDYSAYLPKAITQRAAFDQVQYIERAPNVQRLNDEEKKDLLEIIKLHAWFMNPTVTEEEIDNYEQELAGKTDTPRVAQPARPAPVKDIIYKKETIRDAELQGRPSGIQNFPKTVPRDWVAEAAQRRKEEQKKIDQKLLDLKSRSNK